MKISILAIVIGAMTLVLLACGTASEPEERTGSGQATTGQTPERAATGQTPEQATSTSAPTSDKANPTPAKEKDGLPPTPRGTPPLEYTSAETDREILITLYNATDGQNWDENANWLTDAPLNEWHGVGTDGGGRVNRLELYDLKGRIPPEIGNLTNLQSLNLSGDQLSGEIPPELGNLAMLTRLELDDNQLTGDIPRELGNLGWLGIVYLSNSLSTGCAPDLFIDVGGSANLPACDASDPDDAEALVALYNSLGQPEELRDAGGWLSEVPIGQWGGVSTDSDGRVVKLVLKGQDLTGEIPPELFDLTNLRVLNLSGNEELTGEIPSQIANLANLTGLVLKDNNLTGEIPPEIGKLTNLRVLYLHGNQLAGAIPPTLGNLLRLRGLDLNGNQLVGEIPAELGNLTALSELSLHNNQLTGEIPEELGNLTNLEVFSLGGQRSTASNRFECVPGSLKEQWQEKFDGLPLCP